MIEKGDGNVRVYPHPKDHEYPARLPKDTLRHAKEAEESNKRVFGMRVRSILTEIPDFDIVWSLDPDYMHAVLLGVCRQFANLWFSKSNHAEKFYLGEKVEKLLDSLLESIKPISEISRTPRKMSERQHWKAHEWLSWLLVYSLPLMRKVFPMELVQHWSLLVDAIVILLKKGVTKSEIFFAEKSLISFIQQTEEIYGLEHCSFNVHLLSHLPRSVLNWGPLYGHSAFAFENKNMELQKFVKSSNGVCLQIYNFYRLKFLKWKLEKICHQDLTPKEKKFLEKINKQKINCSVQFGDTVMLGQAQNLKLNNEYYLAFQRGHIPVKKAQTGKFFKKAIMNHRVFEGSSYEKTKKRINFFCLTNNNLVFAIQIFAVINEGCYALGFFYPTTKKSILPPPRKLSHFILLGQKDDHMSVIKTNEIKEKVLALTFDGNVIVATWPGFYDMVT